MKRFHRPLLLFAACATLLAGSGAARAADVFPVKPIRIVIPFPPGGGVDTLARVIAPPLTEVLGKQVVLDNRTGGGGLIGNQIAAQARADGYTLLFQGIPFVVAPQLSSLTGYDPVNDFAPVVLVASTPIVLVTNPGVPANTLKEFVALAKARQGRLNMASGGNGATAHLAAEVFKLSTGAPFAHIPYKGMGPAIIDVIGGQVDAIFATLPSALPQIQAGKLKALAITSPKRSQFAPELQAAQEAGYKDLLVVNWYGLLAPKGIPQAASERISSAVTTVAGRKNVRDQLVAGGLEVTVENAPEFTQFISAEVARWSHVVKASGMRVD